MILDKILTRAAIARGASAHSMALSLKSIKSRGPLNLRHRDIEPLRSRPTDPLGQGKEARGRGRGKRGAGERGEDSG